jgi:rhodanese-related sulfurtransferase
MKRFALFLIVGISIALVGVAAYFAYQYAVDSPFRISSAEAKHLLQTQQIDLVLDVRTDLERSTLGVYPGSVHIQSADLEKEMPKSYPDKHIQILVYCNTGHRARMATDKLYKLGYTRAKYISSQYTTLQ